MIFSFHVLLFKSHVCACVHCSCTMSDLELVSFINEENKRRKRRRIIFIELYFEAVVLGLAYLSSQQGPRDLGCFNDDERRHTLRTYLLKEMYDSSKVTCYDELRLTKRNFHDSCIMLRERCGLRECLCRCGRKGCYVLTGSWAWYKNEGVAWHLKALFRDYQ